MLPFLLLLLVAISLGATGQILLKTGLSLLPPNAPVGLILSSIFTNIYVFLGFACYGISSLIYLVALKNLPLSYAYPMIALSYVVVVTLSWRIFGETIPPLRVAALCVILTGVVMMALSYERALPQSSQSLPASATTAPGSPSDSLDR
jgi:drug/metabolite transporter (DMT)-like permease